MIGSSSGSRPIWSPFCTEIVEPNAGALFPSLDAAATDVSVGGKHDDIAKIP
jgi:hypothetical protein